MIIIRRQELISIAPRYAMHQDIMDSLDIERFFDFRVRRNKQVYQNKGWYEEEEGPRRESHSIECQRALKAPTV